MPVSMMFLMAVHLGNIHSCLYGNQVIWLAVQSSFVIMFFVVVDSAVFQLP